MFYGLSIFVLLNAMFVISDPNITNSHANDANNLRNAELVSASQCRDPESSSGLRKEAVAVFKQQVQQQLAYAFIQTIGDQAVLDELELVWRGVSDFYEQSAGSAIALMQPRDEEQDAVLVMKRVYVALEKGIKGIKGDKGVVAGEEIDLINFMQEEPLYNIHPSFNKPPDSYK